MYTDRKLVCADCGIEFVFSAREQEFYAGHGLVNDPRRCKSCHRTKSAGGPRKEFTEVICENCGAVASVPFKPRGDRPVYCRECLWALRLS